MSTNAQISGLPIPFMVYLGNPLSEKIISHISLDLRVTTFPSPQNLLKIAKFQPIDGVIVNITDLGHEGMKFLDSKNEFSDLLEIPFLVVGEKEPSSEILSYSDDFYFGNLDSPFFLKRILNFSRFHVSPRRLGKGFLNPNELTILAYHDSISGLPNRQYLEIRMEKLINSPAPSCENFSLFYMDLDGFKKVNDTLGHEAGDKILAQVAKRIRDVTRKQDVLARIGGDEFALLVNQGDSPEVLESIGQRILEAISQAYYYKESLISLSASIGIASFPCHGTTREEIVNSADKAMYMAKERGPGKICSFQVA